MRSLVIGVLLLLDVGLASGAETATPKIGVALSGGGARGLAHVGVLQALDELRVPVHYVAGTSMGSIIGGLYATGRHPDELVELVDQIDWDAALAAGTERSYLKFRDKKERRNYNLALEFGLGGERGVAPGGVIAGHNLQLVLRRVIGLLDATSFDDLAIPFRAVATDIQRGEPYSIGHGDLVTALRASMAVPLAFDPVELDGRVLVDGGVLNNLPVDVAREMGADLVIGVNIASPLREISATSSFVNVAYQSIDVALVRNTIESLAAADLVIAPELGSYPATDFDNTALLIEAGYQAVMRKRAFLSGIALSESDYVHYKASQRNPRQRQKPLIAYVEFSGNQRTSTRRLTGIAEQLIGATADIDRIEATTKQMMALRSFQSIGYEYVENRGGEHGIRFLIAEKPWGPHYLRFGLGVVADLELESAPSLFVRHRMLNANPYGGEWTNDLELGTDYALRSEFFQPLGFTTPWFVAAYGEGWQRLQRVFDASGDDQIAQFDLTRYRGGIDLGLNWTNAELRVGAFSGQYRSNTNVGRSGLSGFPVFDDNQGGWRASFGFDDQPRELFATRGWLIDTEAELMRRSLGADSNHERYRLDALWRHPIGSDGALHVQLIGDWLDGAEVDSAFVSFGGFDDFAGYSEGALLGDRALLLRVGGFSKIQPLQLPLVGAPRLVALLHAGRVWSRGQSVEFDDLEYGGLGGMALELLGTSVFVGAGYSAEIDETRFYLNLGNAF